MTTWTVEYPAKLLCPQDFPGKNTGVGCHFLLQEIFSTEGLNQCLLHWQPDSLPLSHQGKSSLYDRCLLFLILRYGQRQSVSLQEWLPYGKGRGRLAFVHAGDAGHQVLWNSKNSHTTAGHHSLHPAKVKVFMVCFPPFSFSWILQYTTQTGNSGRSPLLTENIRDICDFRTKNFFSLKHFSWGENVNLEINSGIATKLYRLHLRLRLIFCDKARASRSAGRLLGWHAGKSRQFYN